MYLRFAIAEIDPDSQWCKGLFTAAYELRDSGALTEPEVAELQELIDWFKKHLPVPKCFRLPDSHKAICWFVPGAGEPVTRMWRLVAFLEARGVAVRLYKTRDPGRRLYSDRHQVVAIPQVAAQLRRAR